MSIDVAPLSGSARSGVFAPAVVLALVVAGFVAFIAYVGLGAYEQDFRGGQDGGAHALSKSAVGYAGLVELLNDLGRPALVARGPIGGGIHEGIVVLTIDRGDPHTKLLDLPTTRQSMGAVLAVLPKWDAAPIPTHAGWVTRSGLRSNIDAETWIGPTPDDVGAKITLGRQTGRAAHTLTLLGADGRPVGTVTTGVIESFQTFRTLPEWLPVIIDDTGATVLARRGDSGLFALSEPDLLNNHGIADIATARAATGVLAAIRPDGPVYFDVTLNGFERTRSVMKLLLEPPFLAATLCALAAAALMIWHAVWRFGAPRRAVRELALGKQTLADNQAGLLRMAGREHKVGGRYAALIATLAARAVGAPRDLGGEALDAFLDRLGEGGRTRERFSNIQGDAIRARDKSQLLDAAERLHRWRLEMTREHD